MLRPRISPILLLSGSGSIKSKNFSREKYLGDIINNIKIFNELSVDELAVYDYDFYRNANQNHDINFDLLRKISREANMPLTYGGGINSIDQAVKLVKLGFEKISICSNALNEKLILEISELVGMQSVVLHFDYKTNFLGQQSFFVNGGASKLSINLSEIVNYVNRIKPGEVCFQSISLDGTGKGFDLSLVRQLNNKILTPIKFCGGCNSPEDFENVNKINPLASFGCSKYFVLHGRLDAVLISYNKPIGWL